MALGGVQGKAPGGGPGDGAPGSSQVLASLSAFGELSHYLEADELFLNHNIALVWPDPSLGGFIFDGY